MFFGFAKQTKKQPKQIVFRFVSVQNENIFYCFEDTLYTQHPATGEYWTPCYQRILSALLPEDPCYRGYWTPCYQRILDTLPPEDTRYPAARGYWTPCHERILDTPATRGYWTPCYQRTWTPTTTGYWIHCYQRILDTLLRQDPGHPATSGYWTLATRWFCTPATKWYWTPCCHRILYTLLQQDLDTLVPEDTGQWKPCRSLTSWLFCEFFLGAGDTANHPYLLAKSAKSSSLMVISSILQDLPKCWLQRTLILPWMETLEIIPNIWQP